MSWFIRAVSLSVTLAFLPTNAATAVVLPERWKTDVGTFTESGPSVADIDGDGASEVIVAGREEMIVLDGAGHERWRWRTRGRFMTYPAIVDEGHNALMVAADNSGLLTALDKRGQVVWQHELEGGATWSSAVVCDLDGNDSSEVIQTADKGIVWALDARSGGVVWRATIDGAAASPAVADIDGDGPQEIAVVTNTGKLIVLGAKGEERWKRDIGGTSETWSTAAPIMVADRKGGQIVAASNAGRVYSFDASGAERWTCEVRGPVASALSAGDVEGDGEIDVFVVTQLGVIYRFDNNGRTVWSLDMQGRSLAAGALIDLDGDGLLEYLLATQNGWLLALHGDGSIAYSRQFDHRTINVTPAFGNIATDSKELEFAVTGGEFGLVYCFGTDTTANTRVGWTAYRGNEQKTGFGTAPESRAKRVRTPNQTAKPVQNTEPAMMTPVNLRPDDFQDGDVLTFRIANAAATPSHPLLALASCTRPDGVREMALVRIFGDQGVLELPFDATKRGKYLLTWSLSDSAGHVRESGYRAISLDVARSGRTLLEALAARVDQIASAHTAAKPQSVAALERESALLLGREVDGQAVRVARRLLGICDVVNATETSDNVIVFETPLWENRDVGKLVPQLPVSALIHCRAVAGEHVPVSVGLFNPLDRDVMVRLSVERTEGGPAVTLRQSVPTVSSLGDPSWDALPRLDESATVHVPSMRTAEVWLDMDTTGVAPGAYTVSLRGQVFNGPDSVDGPEGVHSIPVPEVRADVKLSVMSGEFAPYSAMRLCAWATLDEKAIADLLAHGNTVFVLHLGSAKFKEDGSLVSVDYASLDKHLDALKGHDVELLLGGVPNLGVPADSEAYTARLRLYLNDLLRHLKPFGFGIDDVALYPVDEPAGNGWNAVNRVAQFGKHVRAAMPEMRLYVNGGGELPMFEAMAPYTDIWCPAIYMLPEKSPVMDLVRASKGTLWSYDCAYILSRPLGPNIKNTNIVGQFRTAGMFTFRHGGTGIGYWSYNIGEDMWQRCRFEYALVYAGSDGPMPSRRWEAVREDIEDSRLLAALKARLDDPRPLSQDARQAITQLLETDLPALVDPGFHIVITGLARYAIDDHYTEARLNAFREKMLDCVELAN